MSVFPTFAESQAKAKERGEKILAIYEAGKAVSVIAKDWDITKTRVYQLLANARRRRAAI